MSSNPSYSSGLEFELTRVPQGEELEQGMGLETILRASRLTATPAMIDDSQFSLQPAIGFAQQSHSCGRWRPTFL